MLETRVKPNHKDKEKAGSQKPKPRNNPEI
jgi:hypothetical protein